MNIKLYFVVISLSTCMLGCNKNPYKVDVSGVNTQTYQIFRFEKDLINVPVDVFLDSIISLSDKYPDFLGNLREDTSGIYAMYNALTDPYMKEIFNKCNDSYSDFSPYSNRLTTAFKHINYYYSDFVFPDIYTYVCNYAIDDLYTPIFYDGDKIFVAIDMYLNDNLDYLALGAPLYVIKRFKKEYLVRDCMEQIAVYYNMSDNDYTRLIDLMIYYGKNLEFIKRTMPDVPDTVLFGYTKNQMQWCVNNENDVWKYIVSDNTLFSNNIRVIKKLIDDAPYTSFFGNDSPGSVCKWLGWKIVASYMRNNDVSLSTLMSTTDAEMILSKSNYRPRS